MPWALTTSSDVQIEIVAPNARQLRKLLRHCTGEQRLRKLDEGLASGLKFHEIVAAFRVGASASEIVANLVRAKVHRTKPTAQDDTPTLEELSGLGEAGEWGRALAEGLAAWRRGDVSWATLSTRAVVFGPPGTGKTLFARALAKTLNIPIVTTSVGDWFASSAGYLDSIIKAASAAFEEARGLAPALIFIDELDSLPSRQNLVGRGLDWWTPAVNHVLAILDGATANAASERLIILGATNYIERLDPALVRPGRLSRLIEMRLPDEASLAGILRHHLGAELPDADLVGLARLAPGSTGATAAMWVNQARGSALVAGRALTFDDLLTQIAPLETRPESVVLSIARHEAAHAVVGLTLGVQVLDSVSLFTPLGEGIARFSPNHLLPQSRAHLEAIVVMGLAGRAADEMFDAADTGASADLAKATSLVATIRSVACLCDTMVSLGDHTDVMALLRIDPALRAAVEADLQRLYKRARVVVADRRGDIEAVAHALVHRRFLSGADVWEIVAHPLEANPKPPK